MIPVILLKSLHILSEFIGQPDGSLMMNPPFRDFLDCSNPKTRPKMGDVTVVFSCLNQGEPGWI